MKFARYLKDTQVPEWKKAYIDYRGLKKHIGAIKKAQHNGSIYTVDEESDTPRASSQANDRRSTSSSRPQAERPSSNYGSTGQTPPLSGREEGAARSSTPPPVDLPSPALPLPAEYSKSTATAIVTTSLSRSDHYPVRPRSTRAKSEVILTETRSRASDWSASSSGADLPGPSYGPTINSPGRFLANLRRRQSQRSNRNESSSARIPLPLSIVVPTMAPLERQFMEKLDKELDKVETFYRSRESEAMIRCAALKEQLRELQDHRKLFYEAKATESKWASRLLPQSAFEHFAALPLPNVIKSGHHGVIKSRVRVTTTAKGVARAGREAVTHGKERERSSSPTTSLRTNVRERLDPEEYQHAKKELKKAILEFYKFLELLNNYRVLNLTGFRKALKKFEKTVRVSVQQSYMQEKVESCAFASGATIEKMLKDVEDLYAARFERGDLKKARLRLRTNAKHKSHHFSTFRSGLYLGVALPALIDGLYKSFQPEVRESIPWDSLLLVYATIMIPVLFSLLVGINVWVWNRARINYAFIFDFDIRTQLDSREFFELPAFLLSTLCYAFWLSYSRIGTETIASTTWPLAWLVFAIVVMLNPLPILFPSSRWWLIRKVFRLLISGTKPVEFADFWLGDQFCSLIFTLSNLYFIGCAYEQKWQDVWISCSTAQHWGIPFTLASLPLTVRTVQSIKRYIDSGLYTHLINAGKYSSSILYYAFYFIWRHHNEAHDFTFVLFILSAVNYSLYTCAWDILMDWSLFKCPAQHPFLRKDIVYSSNYFVYYIAVITNVILRFVWVIYIPGGDFNFTLRTFIAAMLEMFRRWQWNFLRLENEHIGNTDQYRATKEVPLPYSFEDGEHDSEEGDEDDEENYSNRSSWRKKPVRMSNFSSEEEGRPAPREP